MSIAKTVYAVPGSRGSTGTAATDGTDGLNAFTLTSAAFIMPAVSGNVVVAVVDSQWAAVGQIVFVEGAGYFTVAAKPSTIQMTLTNLGYSGNSAPATVVALGKRVSPAGVAGSAGSAALAGADADARYVCTNNTDMPTNGFNLGGLTTGLVKITVAAGTATPSTASPSSDYMAYDAELAAIAGLASAANKLAYFTGSGTASTCDLTAFGRSLIGAANAAAAQTVLGLGIASTVSSWTMEDCITDLAWKVKGYTLAGIASGSNVDVDCTDMPIAVITADPGGAFTINGLQFAAWQYLILINATSRNMTIAHQSGVEATATRRIECPTGADMSTTAYGVAHLWYDSTAGYWRLLYLTS